MICEHHGREVITETDLVVTRIGPNRTAVMAALRVPMGLSPAGVGELVRGGVPIVVGTHWDVSEATEMHLKLCGATVEWWRRYYCEVGYDPDDMGAVATA